MKDPPSNKQLQDLFRLIINGSIVKRSRHELRIDERDVSRDFIGALTENGFLPTTVDLVALEPGERVPAFLVENAIAHFGWVFWEKFTATRMRKLFGSVVRNSKGDWAIQIPPTRDTIVFANQAAKTEMDIDHPSDL